MTEPYYTWQTFQATLVQESIRWAGKPGLEAWDALRPSQRLIADDLVVELGHSPGSHPAQVLDLRCGAGVVGALAARYGAQVTLCDDNLVAVQATQRTLDLNGAQGQVIHGLPHDASLQGFDFVLLDAPRGREWVRYLLTVAAQALRPGGKLLLAGPNRGGIKGYIEDANAIVGQCKVTRVKAGHRLVVAKTGYLPTPSLMAGEGQDHPPRARGRTGAQAILSQALVRGQTFHFASGQGIFSSGKLDPGTRALIETMVIQPGETALDLGCGCGIVGAVASRLGIGGQVTCVDASAVALQATRETLAQNGVGERAEVIASDCGGAVLDRRFDVVATNPPFHQGLGVEYDVAQQFVRDAAHVLKPGGRLYLVANRFIRHERIIAGLFCEVRTAYEDNRFRVLAANREAS